MVRRPPAEARRLARQAGGDVVSRSCEVLLAAIPVQLIGSGIQTFLVSWQ